MIWSHSCRLSARARARSTRKISIPRPVHPIYRVAEVCSLLGCELPTHVTPFAELGFAGRFRLKLDGDVNIAQPRGIGKYAPEDDRA